MKSKNGKRDAKAFAARSRASASAAGLTARKTARAHGTPIYIWQDGKVVAQKP